MIHLQKESISFSKSFFLLFLCLISLLCMLQEAFSFLIYPPYLFLPFFVYYLVNCRFIEGLYLSFFLSLVMALYTPPALPQILTCLLGFFIFFLALRRFLFLKSVFAFLVCVFFIALVFPYLFDLAEYMETGIGTRSSFFTSFLKAVSSSLLGFLAFPFLKKYLRFSEEL